MAGTQDIGVRVLVLGVAEARRNIGTFNSDVSRLGLTIDGLATKSKQVGQSISQLGTAVAGIGRSLTIGATLPIVAAGGAAINAGIQFEDAFAGISKTVDGVADSTGQLTALGEEIRQDFRDLALEIPIAATELSKIGEIAGQLGIQGRQDLVDFTETVALIGVATDLSTEQAAFGLARLANIFGKTGDEIVDFSEDAANSLVFLGNNFAATESEILNLSLRLAGAGRQAGLTEADVLGLSTALAAIGVRAELGGSQLSRVLQDILVAVGEGGEDLEKFAAVAGLSAEEFARVFRNDASKALELFLQGLADVEAQGGVSATILDDLGLKGVRIRDVIGRLTGDTGVLSEAIAAANGNWANSNALQEEATKRFATVKSQIQLLKNALTDLGITIFDDLQGPIQSIIGFIKNLITNLREMDPAVRSNVIRILALIAAIGPLLTVIGLLVSLVGTAITAFLGLVTSPILVGMGLLVASFVTLIDFGKVIESLSFENVSAFIERVSLGIRGLFDLLVNRDYTRALFDAFNIHEDAPIVGTLIKIHDWFVQLRETATNVALKVIDIFRKVKDVALDVITVLRGPGEGGLAGKDQNFLAAIHNLGPDVTNTILGFKDKFLEVRDTIILVGKALVGLFKLFTTPTTTETTVTRGIDGSPIIESSSETKGAAKGAQDVDALFGEGASFAVLDFKQNFIRTFDEIKLKVKEFKDEFLLRIQELKEEAIAKAIEFKEEFVPKFIEIKDEVVQIATDLGTGFVEGLTSGFAPLQPVLETAGKLVAGLAIFLGNLGIKFGESEDGATQLGYVIGVLVAGLLVAGGIVLAVVSIIGIFVAGFLVAAVQIGAAIIGLVKAFLLMGAGILTAVGGLFETLIGVFTLNQDLINKGWNTFIDGLTLIAIAFTEQLETTFKTFFPKLAERFSEWTDKIIGFFEGMKKEVVGNSIVPDMVNEVLEWIDKLIQPFSDTAQQIKTVFIDPLTTAFDGFKGLVDRVATSVEEAAQRMIDAMRRARGRITGSPTLAIQHPFEMFDQYLKNTTFDFSIGANIAPGLQDIVSSVPAPAGGNSVVNNTERSVNVTGVPLQDDQAVIRQINRSLANLETAGA